MNTKIWSVKKNIHGSQDLNNYNIWKQSISGRKLTIANDCFPSDGTAFIENHILDELKGKEKSKVYISWGAILQTINWFVFPLIQKSVHVTGRALKMWSSHKKPPALKEACY